MKDSINATDGKSLGHVGRREQSEGDAEQRSAKTHATPAPGLAHKPRAYTRLEAGRALRVGLTTLNELMMSGQIQSYKVGHRRYISAVALERYIVARESVETTARERLNAASRPRATAAR